MDSAYLKKAVGDQLSKGIAHVCEVLPSDPVEYLALWLLHEIQLEEVKAKRKAETDELERQRRDAKGVMDVKRQHAATTIQGEVKHFISKKSKEKLKQQQEEEALHQFEEELKLRM
jgi:cobalamin-dependent methionine synthase I